jgi:HPt (histidine-containing phosphotransfer) domain-containing protein
MDVNMPGMDGYATVREMRALEADGQRPRTPILAFTAHAFAEDVERSRAAGCDGHLSKPLRKVVLMDALARYAHLSARMAAATPEPGGSVVPTSLVRVASELMTYLPEYLDSTRAQLADAMAALDRGDRDPLRVLGHNLKGSGGSFGLQEISRLGSRLEEEAARGADGSLRDRAIALGEYLAGVQVVPEEA